MASSTLWVCRSRHWTTTSRRPDSLKMDSAWPLVSLGRLKKTFQLRRLKCQIDESCEKMQLAEEHAWNERQCVDENSRQLSGNTVSQRELHIAHNTWPLHKNGWVASSWQAWPPSRSSVSCPILPSHWRRGRKAHHRFHRRFTASLATSSTVFFWSFFGGDVHSKPEQHW